MHTFQIQALVFTIGTISAVASPADMLTASMLSSLLSKPDVSVLVFSSAAEGYTTVDDFVTKAQVINSWNKEDNTAALNAQPEYCPDDYENTPMCKDCGGFILLYYKELDFHDTRCKGDDDDIVCDLFAPDPDPDATMRSALEAIALLPDNISYPFADTEFNNDFWLEVPDNL
ncbi:unnamed protein product, partial [Aureobasidium mustum]